MKKLLRNDFFLTFIILGLYLLTNRYVYAWDDQHLEIPTLKQLIDPTLYQGDYYVASLAKQFSSFLYPILAKLITVDQIPSVYMWLFVLVRFGMFYWVFRLWFYISESRGAAFCATIMFFLLGRTEEFLYRTFSHQELSFAFVMAGIYFFWRDRYFIAALIWGIGANFHAIYNLFPMLYMLSFLTFFKPYRIQEALKSGLIFAITCLPFILWQVPSSLAKQPVPVDQWMPVYLLSCPQNFVFQDTPLVQVFSNMALLLEKSAAYLYLTALFIFHCVFNEKVRSNYKLHAVIATAWGLILISYYFTYIHPSRFVLDLNLVRNDQPVRFLLMGLTTIYIYKQVNQVPLWLAFCYGITFMLLGFSDLLALAALMFLGLILMVRQYWMSPVKKNGTFAFSFIGVSSLLFLLLMAIKGAPFIPAAYQRFFFIVLGLLALTIVLYVLERFYASYAKPAFRLGFIIIPLLGMFVHFATIHYNFVHLRAKGSGFWQMQRNWEDMQYYVKAHTPKDALIMTPYNTDLGGFRIRSERKVLVCYRDCGIVGFDFKASQEWQRRIKDIEEFKLYTDQKVDRAMLNGILKYGVDYIVFMNYYQPQGDNQVLKKIYQNEVFALYQVMVKPPQGVR